MFLSEHIPALFKKRTLTERLRKRPRACQPIAGRTPQARHASSTGALAERERRGRFALVYRQLLVDCGPLSDQEAAKITGRAVSTLNSTRAAFGDRIKPSGTYETATFADGRSTRRVRWQWVTDQGETQA